MNVLVIGSGGREHAIVKKLKESRRAGKIYCLPGNAGISLDAECVPGSVMDFDHIVKVCKEKEIGLCFVAPDDPLGAGLVNRLNAENIRAFGPAKEAAIIESSKAFSKAFMEKHNIPTAKYRTFTDEKAAKEYIISAKYPLVVKADGLALGKGVIICQSADEANAAVTQIMAEKAFGSAGDTIVIEEFLEGKEVTVLTFTDGKTVKCMPSSQDHKKAFDGDKGLNTGGMGAFSPSLAYTKEIAAETMEKIIIPTIKGLKEENREFKGVIYFGLMLTKDGAKVLEYNARFGDPETQCVLPLLKTDFLDIIDAVIDGKLSDLELTWENKASAVVILASGGYPEKYEKGFPITIGTLDGVSVFHSGTAFKDGILVTNGGRVLGVAATGTGIATVRETIYRNIQNISFKNMYYRKDIGIKL